MAHKTPNSMYNLIFVFGTFICYQLTVLFLNFINDLYKGWTLGDIGKQHSPPALSCPNVAFVIVFVGLFDLVQRMLNFVFYLFIFWEV